MKDFYDINDSVLIYAGELFYGVDKIMDKFNSLSKIASRNITASDFQPTSDAGVILNIFGKVLFNDINNNMTLFFTEMFVLKPRVTAYYIQNQYYRSSGIYNGTGAYNTDGLHFV